MEVALFALDTFRKKTKASTKKVHFGGSVRLSGQLEVVASYIKSSHVKNNKTHTLEIENFSFEHKSSLDSFLRKNYKSINPLNQLLLNHKIYLVYQDTEKIAFNPLR